jgi:tRNA nucleotidyltransferase/poly(A) polymerase
MTGEVALGALLREPALAALLDALDGPGEETRVVGGAVRNLLLGRPATDVDLATTAIPDEVMRRARAVGFGTVPTGLDHGTVAVLVHGRPFEVTTLREDIETDGRHAVVRFGRDFAADAARRDFTINALSVGRGGRVHDTVGGLADLAARRVRFIGDPARRIREDYLRILRLFRFHAEYGDGPLDREGLTAAIRERGGLALLSRERIRGEILKLLAAPRAVEVVGEMSDAGFLAAVLAGVGDLGRLARASRIAEGGSPSDAEPDPLRRLAALAVAVPEDAERLREGLRLSNAEADRLAAYARVVSRLRAGSAPLDEGAVRRLAAEHGVAALADALAATAGEARPTFCGKGADAVRRLLTGAEPPPTFPLRGADLVAEGVPVGPRIGEGLARARDAWLSAGCPTGPDAAARLLPVALKAAAA